MGPHNGEICRDPIFGTWNVYLTRYQAQAPDNKKHQVPVAPWLQGENL